MALKEIYMPLKLIMQNHIDEFAGKLDKKFRPTYHISTPIGWINDPNGFCYAFNKIHCFAQFYPFATHWGQISWGHFTSDDFVKWEWQPIALYPEHDYEHGIGIMSGTAMMDGDKMIVAYAAGSREGDIEKQQIALAVSADGINFVKDGNNPIIKTEDIPDGYSKVHFRDPKVFKNGDLYYLLITSSKDEIGQLLLFKSPDLKKWEFVGSVIKEKFNMRGAFECPDFFSLDGKDVILCSPQFLKSKDGARHQNVHSSVFMLGEMDLKKGEFKLETFDDIDSGIDFYAPQHFEMPDGRKVVIAWMNNWDKNYPSEIDGWVGSMVFPREVKLVDGKFYQTPVRELEKYRKDLKQLNVNIDNKEVALTEINGKTADIIFIADITSCDKFGIKFFADDKYYTEFYYDKNTGTCVLDRSKGGIKIASREEQEANVRYIKYQPIGNTLKLRVLLDVSSAEIFIDEGVRVMTTTVFCPTLADGVKVYTEGKAKVSVEKYDLVVKD